MNGSCVTLLTNAVQVCRGCPHKVTHVQPVPPCLQIQVPFRGGRTSDGAVDCESLHSSAEKTDGLGGEWGKIELRRAGESSGSCSVCWSHFNVGYQPICSGVFRADFEDFSCDFECDFECMCNFG